MDVTGLTSGVSAISVGGDHTCILTISGGAKCWGGNQYGQLGNGTNTSSNIPLDVSGLTSGVIAISAGDKYTCALTSGSGIKCWGWNAYGQLGDGTNTDRNTPVDVSGLVSGVSAISASCALMTSGAVKCWGSSSNTPVDVIGLPNGIGAISATGSHACALTSSGGVKCWGRNYNGILGDGTNTDSSTPVDVIGLTSGVSAISAGGNNSCALTSGGGVKCWGWNDYGQIGNGTNNTYSNTPVDVSGLFSGLSTISVGSQHACTLTNGGGVKCWGRNGEGQLGDGTTPYRNTPADVSGLTSGVSAIAAGGYQTCALADGGSKCWGSNGYGQLGDGTYTNRHTPVDVIGLTSGVSAIATGLGHTCALTSGGGVKCWGLNAFGERGDGTNNTYSNTPVDVIGLTSGVSAISAGDNTTCALTFAGSVKCWGRNNLGQLGNGTTTDSNTPVDVSGLTSGVSAISAGGDHTCALTSGGGVKCWGNNLGGGLGDGTNTNRNTPVAVSGLTSGVNAVDAGSGHTCALTSGGGVKCFGYSRHGQLGDGTGGDRNTPVDVSGLTSGVSAISVGSMHSCALTSGGVKCWGNNSYGELGNGTIMGTSMPVDVSGLTSGVSAISAGNVHTCALTSGGGVKCWGWKQDGLLGDGTNTNSNVPVNVFGSGSISISGRVVDGSGNGMVGVSVSGGAGHTASTDSSGNYTLSGFAPGVYAITPSKTGYTFNPISRAIYIVSASMTGVNFIGTTSTYSISGRVVDGSGNGVAGVSASGGVGHTATTDRSGNYTLSGFAPGVYAITPSKTAYTFNPISRAINIVSGNMTGVDFTGIQATYSISGRVVDGSSNGVAGVNVSDGAGHTATTNGAGNYTLTGLPAGIYTLTPSKSGYAFAPTSRTVLLPRDGPLAQDFYAQPTAAVIDLQHSTVSASPTSIVADGQVASTITVLLRNATGAPVVGEAVRLVVEEGQAVIEQPPVSDSAGQAVGRVRSFAPGTVTISAWVGGSRVPAAVNITFIAGVPVPDPLRTSARTLATSGDQAFTEMWRDIQGVVSEAYYFQDAQLEFGAKIAADIVGGVADAFMRTQEWEKGWRESAAAARLAFPGWGVLADSPAFANETACKISNSFITDLAGAGDAGAARKVAGLVFRGGLLYLTAQHKNQCVKDVALDVALDGNSLLTLLRAHFGQPTDSWPIKKQMDAARQVQQAELSALERTRIAPLSPAQVEAYSEDLSARAQMLPVFQDRLHDALLTLQNVHAANESTGWGGELLQTILRQTATLAAKGWFDGAGQVLVGGYLAAFDTYMDSHALSESIQMATFAYGTMSYTAPQAVLSAGNTVIAGLDQINRGLPPHTPKGAITKVEHTNIAAGWGPWRTPMSAYTDISISNTGIEGADFHVVARYLAQTTRLMVPWAQLWLESDSLPVHLAPGAKAVVRVNYLGSGLGYPPREATFIQFTLVGADDAATGLFHADFYAAPWPAAQSQSAELAGPTSTDGANALSPVIDYPLVSLAVSNPAQGFNGYLWVNNPYAVSVPVTVTQPIAANMMLDDAGLGISASQQITWTAFVAPLASQVFTYTFSLSDAPGITLTLPSAVLSLASPDAGVLTATATTRPVPIPWPVTLNRHVPAFTAPGIAPSVTVTATNHLTNTVAASVSISVTSAAGLPVWSSSQPLTITGQSSQTTIFTLPANLPVGEYSAIGFLQVQGAKGRAFEDPFAIGARHPDLSVIAAPVAADGTVASGATITYSVRIANTAAVPLTNLAISTTLPTDLNPVPGSISDGGTITSGSVTWHVNTLAAGATRTLSYRVAIPLAYVPPGSGRYLQTIPTLTAYECPLEMTGTSATVLVMESKRVFLPTILRSQ